MAMIIIGNVQVYTESRRFVRGCVLTEGDRILGVTAGEHAEDFATEHYCSGDEIIDGEGGYLLPGMIDLHFHGCMGDDFSDGNMEALRNIARYERSIGVTAISPATMTLPVEELKRVLSVAAQFRRDQADVKRRLAEKSDATISPEELDLANGADLVGVNMEGPFISPVKRGAQDEHNIIPRSSEVFGEFQKAAEGLVRFIAIAPEEESDESIEQFIAHVRRIDPSISISLAHTNSDYEHAMRAFNAGADHAVHLFNAMPPFLHRAPGVIGAIADSPQVMAEIICDNVHVQPAAVRGAFRMLGHDRMILISDSMRATGMPDGQYTLGGLDVIKKGKHATTVRDGALAGSVTSLPDCVRTVVREMDIPLETAIACATINPARSLGIDREYGSISAGKKADMVIWNKDLELQAVIKDGRHIAG